MPFAGLAVAIVCVAAAPWQDAAPAPDALELLRAGDLPGALKAAEARLAAHPDDAGALAVRGRVLLDHPGGREPGVAATQALDDLERAVGAGVADPATLVALSRAHARMRDLTHDGMARRAHDLGARENAKRARTAAEAALQAKPDDAWHRKALADVLLWQGEPAKALALFQQILAAPPPDAPEAFLADARRAADNARAQLVSADLATAMEARRWADAIVLAGELVTLVHADPQPCLALAYARAQHAPQLTDPEAAFVMRTAAAQAYLDAVERDVRNRAAARARVDEGCAGLQNAYDLALVFIARGRGEAGRAVLHRLHELLPPGRARARITISIATELKEMGEARKAIVAYRQAATEYESERLGNVWDRIFLAKAHGDRALVHRALLLGPAARPTDRNACVAAFRASMNAAPLGDAYAVYARVNLARLLAHEGDAAGARTLLRQALDRAAERARPDGQPDEAARLTDTLNVRRFLRELG